MNNRKQTKHGRCPECREQLSMVELVPSGEQMKVCDFCGYESNTREQGSYHLLTNSLTHQLS